jgi:hypothetical protein
MPNKHLANKAEKVCNHIPIVVRYKYLIKYRKEYK